MANNGTDPGVESVGFDDLAPLAHRLNSSSDDLNAALRRIEARLNALTLGIEAFVPIEVTREWVSERQHEPEEFHEDQLGFGRLGDGWGLLTRTAHFTDLPPDSDPGDCWEFGEEKSLLRASRPIRIHAVSVIPNLLKQLKSEADKVLSVVEHAERLADEGTPGEEPPAPVDDTLRCPCVVSERALQFYSGSSATTGGEYITVDVVKGTESARRLARLFVRREDLTRALNLVRPKQ